jgi:hypothetical protein
MEIAMENLILIKQENEAIIVAWVVGGICGILLHWWKSR